MSNPITEIVLDLIEHKGARLFDKRYFDFIKELLEKENLSQDLVPDILLFLEDSDIITIQRIPFLTHSLIKLKYGKNYFKV